MADYEIIKLLLDTSYRVTAFSIAQSLVFLYALREEKFVHQIYERKKLVIRAIYFFTLLYALR